MQPAEKAVEYLISSYKLLLLLVSNDNSERPLVHTVGKSGENSNSKTLFGKIVV